MLNITDIHESWRPLFDRESQKPYFDELSKAVDGEYSAHVCFPPKERLFTALKLTPLDDVRVVILGQDPYHNDGQAQGLAFSVPDGVRLPPSLRNIAKELEDELGYPCMDVEGWHGDLTPWAKHGVLLLNTSLSVRAHEPASHSRLGWQALTDAIIAEVNAQARPIVFMLWGAHAQSKQALLNNPSHLVLTSAHPSPLSAHKGFLRCGHFVRANEWLEENGVKPIEWSLLGDA